MSPLLLAITFVVGGGPAEDSWSAFQTVYKVLQHPRCLNCHPAGDAPLQTDKSRAHRMNIRRGSDEVGLPCAACHRADFIDAPGFPPGAKVWHLAPREMVFERQSPAVLCAQLKDPKRNGNKSMKDLIHHVEHDALVLYGWAPGGGRTKVPTPHATFVEAVKTWIASGAACGPS